MSYILIRSLGELQPEGASQKFGRAGGPDSFYRDHWWLQLGKKKLYFSRVILALGAILIFSVSFNGKKNVPIAWVSLVPVDHANLLCVTKFFIFF